MELDEYKIIVRQRSATSFHIKGLADLDINKRKQTESLVSIIKNNLILEIAFALLFLIFDSYLVIFSKLNHQRGFAFLLLVFCCGYIYYLLKLLKYIQFQHTLTLPVKEVLERYIKIIQRFTRLYFQLTMVLIPLIFLLVFISGYSDNQAQRTNINVLYSSQRLWIYFGIAALWSCSMYFFTRWYIRKLYGNHLSKLREQLRELQTE